MVVYNFSDIKNTFSTPLLDSVTDFWNFDGMVSICLIRSRGRIILLTWILVKTMSTIFHGLPWKSLAIRWKIVIFQGSIMVVKTCSRIQVTKVIFLFFLILFLICSYELNILSNIETMYLIHLRIYFQILETFDKNYLSALTSFKV